MTNIGQVKHLSINLVSTLPGYILKLVNCQKIRHLSYREKYYSDLKYILKIEACQVKVQQVHTEKVSKETVSFMMLSAQKIVTICRYFVIRANKPYLIP